MQTLSNWLIDNRLSLNTDKIEYSIFHTNRTLIPDNCTQLSFGNYTINRVRESKYLGIILDGTLSWDSHIKYLTDQLVKYSGIFKLISKLVPQECKR